MKLSEYKSKFQVLQNKIKNCNDKKEKDKIRKEMWKLVNSVEITDTRLI